MTLRHLSGIQPSGDLHLGNYFGAIRQHIANQDNSFYFIANYHALTTVNNAAVLRQQTREAAATYLALGLDPSRATLFRQSDVPEVAELTWLLATTASKGILDRAVSYKDKVAHGIMPNLGLYIYPVLMAADILIYETDVVPVGSDQIQHVEMCRDMAQSFNAHYGRVFKLPNYSVGTPVPVPGTDGLKMSKSLGNTIPVMADHAELKKKVYSIVTDTKSVQDPKDPEYSVIFGLYRLFVSEAEANAMAGRYRAGGLGYSEAKKLLLEKIDQTFGEARLRYASYVNDPEEIESILRTGAARARGVARSVLDRVRHACGI